VGGRTDGRSDGRGGAMAHIRVKAASSAKRHALFLGAKKMTLRLIALLGFNIILLASGGNRGGVWRLVRDRATTEAPAARYVTSGAVTDRRN